MVNVVRRTPIPALLIRLAVWTQNLNNKTNTKCMYQSNILAVYTETLLVVSVCYVFIGDGSRSILRKPPICGMKVDNRISLGLTSNIPARTHSGFSRHICIDGIDVAGGFKMWVCGKCKELNDEDRSCCSKCDIPKGNYTEHIVVKNYIPGTDLSVRHLTLSEGDLITVLEKSGDIWKGKIGRQEGWFPNTCIGDKINTGIKYRVITPYSSEETDHLRVVKGDVVNVVNKNGSNGLLWVQFDDQNGWIPEQHLETAFSDKAGVGQMFLQKRINTYEETRNRPIPDTLKKSSTTTSSCTYDTDECYHRYDYIDVSDFYGTCKSSMSEPEENRGISKLMPLRPRLPTPKDSQGRRCSTNGDSIDSQTHKEEDAAQMATLYGGREKNEIRLVMVGKTGSGKSATGNTIMQKANYFESTVSAGSVTRNCQRAECKQEERKIIVVDTPGLFDTNVHSGEVSEEITRCINMSIPGPHAFLLVVPLTRFTNEEFESFNRLFELFGDEMGRFACIVFTRLDDLERSKTSIKKFIDTAPNLKNFIERCSGRYIAFDNTASDRKKKDLVKKLIKLVDLMMKANGGNYYTNKLYIEAEAALQRKVKELEEEKAQQKRKEIELIQLKFQHEIDSMRKENKILSEKVSSNEQHQQLVHKEREETTQKILKMQEEIKNIDKKRNQEKYQIMQKEKEETEKRVKELAKKEIKYMEYLETMKQEQKQMDSRYQHMEQQRKLEVSKATEEHNTRMKEVVQRIVDVNTKKYNELLEKFEAKDKRQTEELELLRQQNKQLKEKVESSGCVIS